MDLKFEIEYWLEKQKDRIEWLYYKSKYNDYSEKYMQGLLCKDSEFVWGVKASDDVFSGYADLYTMNDIGITYNRKTKKYSLSVETIYGFNSKKDRVNYYLSLLGHFKEYMLKNKLDTSTSIFNSAKMTGYFNFAANSIEDLYSIFRINVLGYVEVLLNND